MNWQMKAIKFLIPIFITVACIDPGGVTTITPTSWCIDSFSWRYNDEIFQERSVGASVNTFRLTLKEKIAEGSGYFTAKIEQIENGQIDTLNVTIFWPFAAPYEIINERLFIDADDSFLSFPELITILTNNGAKSSMTLSNEQLIVVWGNNCNW